MVKVLNKKGFFGSKVFFIDKQEDYEGVRMDLRNVITRLETEKELVRINKNVSPRYEMAAITSEMEKRENRALLFEKISGRQGGMAVGNIYGTAGRILMALGREKTSPERDARKVLKKLITSLELTGKKNSGYLIVRDNPLEKYDLKNINQIGHCLPAPLDFEDEEEPHLNAAVLTIRTRQGDLASQVVQAQVKTNGVLAVSPVSPPLSQILIEAERSRQVVEAAIIIGVPAELMVAAVTPPEIAGQDKISFAALLRGEPMPMINGMTVSVPFPVEAEYVIEGYIRPWVKLKIGPYNSYYKCLFQSDQACEMQITAVGIRREPVYEFILPDRLETANLIGIPTEITLEKIIAGLIKAEAEVYLTPGGCAHNAVVSVRQSSSHQIREMIVHLLKLPFLIKNIIVVDSDIEPDDPWGVEWSLAARVQADRDLVVLSGERGSPLDPSAEASGLTAKLGIDATTKKQRFPSTCLDPEILHKVNKNWNLYFTDPAVS